MTITAVDTTPPAVPVSLEKTPRRAWLFLGYWEDSTLYMSEAVPDDDDDARDLRVYDRKMAREYPEGLWSDRGIGRTVEEAWRNAIAKYLDEDGYALY